MHLGHVTRSDGSVEQVAVKKVKGSISEKEEEELKREYKIVQGLNHPNIVSVKGVVYDPHLLLIMEYLPCGSLLDYFATLHTRPGLKQLMKFATDICEVLEETN